MKKYDVLNDNIVHLSFHIRNLYLIRKLQKKEDLSLTKTDLLIDFKFFNPFVRFYSKFLDVVSLGIKEIVPLSKFNVDLKTRLAAKSIAFGISKRNAVDEKLMRRLVKIKESIGIYTINNLEGIKELFSRVSKEFLDEYADKIIITTANPKYIRGLCEKETNCKNN